VRLGTVESVHQDEGYLNDNPIQQLNPEALAAEVTGFLEQVPVADGIGPSWAASCSGSFCSGSFCSGSSRATSPQADRAAGQGIDPTPLFAVTAEVLRRYADALHPPDVAE
jgi:hypothetical protein